LRFAVRSKPRFLPQQALVLWGRDFGQAFDVASLLVERAMLDERLRHALARYGAGRRPCEGRAARRLSPASGRSVATSDGPMVIKSRFLWTRAESFIACASAVRRAPRRCRRRGRRGSSVLRDENRGRQ
jgi:hypothetical protein